jgi:hypothetical protein
LKDSAFPLTTFYEFLLAFPPAKYPNFTHIVGTEALLKAPSMLAPKPSFLAWQTAGPS